MLTVRLRERVPSAVAIGIGRIKGHVLRWHKRSQRDGSGKCDAEATGRDTDVVWGVLFEIKSSEERALDAAEGYRNGYDKKQIDVVTDSGTVKAAMYYATDKNASLKPYHWYKAFVVAGAREHGLPANYVQSLEAVRSDPDPDPKRAADNEKLLSAG